MQLQLLHFIDTLINVRRADFYFPWKMYSGHLVFQIKWVLNRKKCVKHNFSHSKSNQATFFCTNDQLQVTNLFKPEDNCRSRLCFVDGTEAKKFFIRPPFPNMEYYCKQLGKGSQKSVWSEFVRHVTQQQFWVCHQAQ